MLRGSSSLRYSKTIVGTTASTSWIFLFSSVLDLDLELDGELPNFNVGFNSVGGPNSGGNGTRSIQRRIKKVSILDQLNELDLNKSATLGPQGYWKSTREVGLP